MRLTLIVSALMMGFSCLGLYFIQHHYAKKMLERELRVTAEVTAAGLVDVLQSHDEQSAEMVLAQVLKIQPRVWQASILRTDNSVLANYRREAGDGDSAATEALYPVQLGEQRIGSLYLRFDNGAPYPGLWQWLIALLLIALSALFIAWLVSLRLRRAVVLPLRQLVDLSRTIVKEENFSLRSQKFEARELAWLADSFNAMLDKVHERDQELAKQIQQSDDERHFFKHVLDSVPQALVVVDTHKFRISAVNKSYLNFFTDPGYAADCRKVLTRLGLESMVIDFVEEAEPMQGRAVSCLAGDGRELSMQLSLIPLAYRHQILLMLEDVTARRAAEQALRDEQQRARKVMSAISDAVIGIDQAGRVVYLNPVAEQLCGRALKQARGSLVTQLLPLQDLADGQQPLLGLLANPPVPGKTVALPVCVVDGRSGQLSGSVSFVAQSGEEAAGAVIVLQRSAGA